MKSKQDAVNNIDFIMTMIRPLVNVDEWAASAKKNNKSTFLAIAAEPKGDKNTRRIARHLKSQGIQVLWDDLLDAYLALASEFADWYYGDNTANTARAFV